MTHSTPKRKEVIEIPLREQTKRKVRESTLKKRQREKVIHQMREDGLNPKEIANRLQVSRTTVYCALRSWKAKPRDNSFSPKRKPKRTKSFEKAIAKMNHILETPERLQQWLSEIIPKRQRGYAECTTLPQSQFTDAQYQRLLSLLEGLKQRQAIGYIENELSVTIVIHKRI